MNIKNLIYALSELVKTYPNATVYIGHKDGSGSQDPEARYLVGEYVDSNLVNNRAFCLGERMEITKDIDDPAIYDFDSDTAYYPL